MIPNPVKKAFAACDPSVAGINLGDCVELSDGRTVSEAYDTPATLVNLIVSNLFVVAGILIFLFLIAAGFKFITGDSKGKEESKSIFTGAIAGFAVMFAAYWIVQIVQQVTGADILF